MWLRDSVSWEHSVSVGGSEARPRLRAALLDALADSNGQALSERDVAIHAGLSPSRFGECYRDLDECMLDAYDALADDVYDTFAHAFDGPGDWHARFATAIDVTLARLLSIPGAMSLWFLEARRTADHELQSHSTAARDRLVGVLTQPGGSCTLDVPDLHVEFLFGALAHAAHDELAAGGDGESAGQRIRELLVLLEPVSV